MGELTQASSDSHEDKRQRPLPLGRQDFPDCC